MRGEKHTHVEEPGVSINNVNSLIDGNVYINPSPLDERTPGLPGAVVPQVRADSFEASAMSGKLDTLLEDISDRGANVLDALKDRAGALQENFLDGLYTKLDANGIDLQEKLTLRLDAEGKLAAAGEHPQKERIDAMLADSPELADSFKDIASHSELMRDIGNIRKTVSARGQIQQYESVADSNPVSVYQLSLKGGMSHFFFSRPYTLKI